MKPGLYDGIDERVYHADTTSLSVSGAKKLLPPSCPALFKYDRDNGQAPRRVFDFGHAAHAKVLGVGAEIVVVQKVTRDKQRVDAEDYKTASAQEHGKEIREAGKTPLLRSELVHVEGMAKALREHPVASALLNPERGKFEQSLYWHDLRHDVLRRGRCDFIETDRLQIVDYKTAAKGDLRSVSKACATWGYDQQAAWYSDLVSGLGLADDPAFIFLFQMKTPPYLVTPVQLDDEALLIGRLKNNEALRIYAECVRTDTWPGYADAIELIALPSWASYDYELDIA